MLHTPRPLMFVFSLNIDQYLNSFTILNRLRECGHSFCGECIRKIFSPVLERRLQQHSLLTFSRLDNYNPYKAPTSAEHMAFTVEGLQNLNYRPRDYFVYGCPTCKRVIRMTPVDGIQLKQVLSDLMEVLGDRPDLLPSPNDMVDESTTGAEYITGLFL